jgi:hypothetical protein
MAKLEKPLAVCVEAVVAGKKEQEYHQTEEADARYEKVCGKLWIHY